MDYFVKHYAGAKVYPKSPPYSKINLALILARNFKRKFAASRYLVRNLRARINGGITVLYQLIQVPRRLVHYSRVIEIGSRRSS